MSKTRAELELRIQELLTSEAQLISRIIALENVLREFVTDIELVCETIEVEWPDLAVTYGKAHRLLVGRLEEQRRE